ncbi:MAG: alpha-mannosidase [Faecousia sp.]
MEKFRMQEQRFSALREMLEFGVYHVVSNLKIEGYTSPEPLSFDERFSGEYRVWTPGEHWGDLFDCGWFHFTGEIPPDHRDRHLAVLVDLSAEGLIVDADGNAVQGITSATSRNEFPLGLWGKRTIELKDCLNAQGRIDFWGDFTCMDVEGQYKNNGRIKEACLAWIDDDARDCFYDWVVCQSLFVGLCENGDPYGGEVGEILERAAAALQDGARLEAASDAAGGDTEALMMGRHAYGRQEETGFDKAGERISVWPDPETEPTRKTQRILSRDAVVAAREILKEILSRPNDGSTMRYSSVGHSHLDLLFLWPQRETPRKCARTMSTVMKMMERFPEYKFTLSQAPVYIWLKAQYPALYEKMVQRIREKRLEVVGALYVECDTNLPGGESLVRQLLYGKRFFQKEFALDMQVGFLPDVFGYSAALPQLFVKAEVPYFTTNKLSMNDTNRFPRYTFWWYGLDGTKILTHMLPENSYTSASVPQMAIYGEYHYTDKDLCPQGLQLYGLGDGGGGPGYEHMERRRRSRDLKGTPPLEDEFVVDFFRRIEKDSGKYRSWHGELYFERHQGTYTSMAKQKKWNRTLEKDLHLLEWLASILHGEDGYEYPSEWLEKAWQDVMLYQFHDCLPGSAIDLVYAETQARYQKLHDEARGQIEECKRRIARKLGASGMAAPVLVLNPSSFDREERIARDGLEMRLRVDAYGAKVVDFALAAPAGDTLRDGGELLLENRRIRVAFHPDGTVYSVYDKALDVERIPRGKLGNVIRLYPDENTHWDIEKAYLSREGTQAEVQSVERCDAGTRQMLRFRYRIGEASQITQTVSLDPDSARVDFDTSVMWLEEYQMLRVSWPVDVVAQQASCEIQFGHVKRPTHQNTTWDQAKFEVCAHKWVDISDRNGGLAMLNDCKYGYKVWDGVMDLCLLRSQNCPCPHGDRGNHSFVYSIYPHGGDVWDGGVVREGYLLNYPLEILPLEGKERTGSEMEPIARILGGTVVLESIKKAEDGDDLILRFYEASGGNTRAEIKLNGYEAVSLCNLLEKAVDTGDLTVTGDGAVIRFHAFEIQSLIIRKK